ncbi:MAG: pyridoxamine 5'-phosphate oxidase [Betaproteobacteria bacterium]
MELEDISKDYKIASMGEQDVYPSPFKQFEKWFSDAVAAQVPEPNAMTLATVDAEGRPAARIVLIKDFDERGASFFTNYTSRKGDHLAANPNAALVFFWPELERQVRMEGAVERVSAAESDAYYRVRPVGSRIGAWASPQSKVIDSRETLDARVRMFTEQYGDAPVRPPFWGGYRLVPIVMEFWQGRASRLHDRIQYRRSATAIQGAGAWTIERLAP